MSTSQLKTLWQAPGSEYNVLKTPFKPLVPCDDARRYDKTLKGCTIKLHRTVIKNLFIKVTYSLHELFKRFLRSKLPEINT